MSGSSEDLAELSAPLAGAPSALGPVSKPGAVFKRRRPPALLFYQGHYAKFDLTHSYSFAFLFFPNILFH